MAENGVLGYDDLFDLHDASALEKLHALTLLGSEFVATNQHIASQSCFKIPTKEVRPFHIEGFNLAQWYAEYSFNYHPWIHSMFVLMHVPGQDPERIELMPRH